MNDKETLLFWRTVGDARRALLSDGVGPAVYDCIDELEVLAEHCESDWVRSACRKAIAWLSARTAANAESATQCASLE